MAAVLVRADLAALALGCRLTLMKIGGYCCWQPIRLLSFCWAPAVSFVVGIVSAAAPLGVEAMFVLSVRVGGVPEPPGTSVPSFDLVINCICYSCRSAKKHLFCCLLTI